MKKKNYIPKDFKLEERKVDYKSLAEVYKTPDETYNEAVDDCIGKLVRERNIWFGQEFKNNPTRLHFIQLYENLISKLEQLKKPIQ